MKEIKGEKYIYLAMAYELAKNAGGYRGIGRDNGYKGGQSFWRSFKVLEHNGATLLQETKTSASSADFSRYFQVLETESRPIIREYITEDNENASKKWIH